MSIGGDNAALELSLLKGTQGAVVIGYDADKAGERMARRAREIRPDAIRLAPIGGKDWNEVLIKKQSQSELFRILDTKPPASCLTKKIARDPSTPPKRNITAVKLPLEDESPQKATDRFRREVPMNPNYFDFLTLVLLCCLFYQFFRYRRSGNPHSRKASSKFLVAALFMTACFVGNILRELTLGAG